MKSFAKLNSSDIVHNIIVAGDKAIASDMFGSPNEFIEAKVDYVEIGCKYNKELKSFIQKKPFIGWVLDDDGLKWKAPKDKPIDADKYYWDEDLIDWAKIK